LFQQNLTVIGDNAASGRLQDPDLQHGRSKWVMLLTIPSALPVHPQDN
jgi:hypothetical protein